MRKVIVVGIAPFVVDDLCAFAEFVQGFGFNLFYLYTVKNDALVMATVFGF